MDVELLHFGARVTSIAAVRIVLGPCLVGSTVLSTVNLLENFGAQRAIQVQTAAFSSPRN